ncbi:Arm DNA-binding domain-containing protein [Paraburkholderia aspalathi]|uniref:Arm DNA-binding domain-containing protein n=1 Tax=Paraburkholderia aspalathi TaxID=1324617 RepID=UPI00313FE6C5
MKFGARRAKPLQPQQHIACDDFPGLRLEATATRRTWTYRYRSPLDGNMRQIKLGDWPAMPLAAAVVQRETKRGIRDTGEDPALARRRARGHVAVLDAKHGLGAYTVR